MSLVCAIQEFVCGTQTGGSLKRGDGRDIFFCSVICLQKGLKLSFKGWRFCRSNWRFCRSTWRFFIMTWRFFIMIWLILAEIFGLWRF